MKKWLIPCVLACLWIATSQGTLPYKYPFLPLTQSQDLFVQDGEIVLSIKPLTPEESEKYFQNDLKDLGYQPVQVTIENQSQDPYQIEIDSINVEMATAKQVAKAAKRSSIPGSIGFKVAGFIFWPFSIAGAFHGLQSIKAYDQFKESLEVKMIKEETVAPYTIMNRVICIPVSSSIDYLEISFVNQSTLEMKKFHIDSYKTIEEPKLSAPLALPEENYYLEH